MANKTNTEINGTKYYRLRLLIGYDSSGKKIFKNFFGKSKSEAELKRNAFKQDLKNGMNIDAGELTLNAAFKDWIFNVIMPSGIKTSTFETYESIYRLYIKDSEIGIKKIKDTKSHMIQAYLNKLFKNGKKYPIILKLTKLLKRFFNYEIETDVIIKNPCLSVKIPGQINYLKEKNSNEVLVFTRKERDIIIEYLYKTNSRIASIAYLGFSLGMREGEILGLSWNDIDQTNNILSIKTSLRKTKDFDEEGNKIGISNKLTIPKTMSSVREIEYTDSFKDMWNRAKDQNINDALVGTSFNNKNNLVFTNALGDPVDKKYVIRQWKTVLEALELVYRPFHTTRHTFVTHMAIDGVPESITQSIIGHKKGSEVTHKIYTHINKESTKKVLENYKINVPNI
ncbi:tyrosine-type recombinase/integrase [Clostridium estertheticum]|uniref:tyrosine-type recombinase/integrase n=1 Tax=Clostridium estertheticum TaxID=238834 RepID=UPI0014789552|nr:site-specific integrase [Clostridium estertheticum]MBZ9615338.1 site-specific integrase [Clostridium estertheticum subsp. laramiense]WAG75227.1 site-specific integrase [Clostridium estertheticum]